MKLKGLVYKVKSLWKTKKSLIKNLKRLWMSLMYVFIYYYEISILKLENRKLKYCTWKRNWSYKKRSFICVLNKITSRFKEVRDSKETRWGKGSHLNFKRNNTKVEQRNI